MSFVPVVNQQEITRGFDIVLKNWMNGSELLQSNITWSGKHKDPQFKNQKVFDIWWRSQEKIWAFFCQDFPRPTGEKWHLFFAGLLKDTSHVNIDSQFVLTATGYNRRLGGVFLESDGQRYLGHTSMVGGGVKGFGPTVFLDYCKHHGVKKVDTYSDNAVCIVDITWSDNTITEGFCIANITSVQLPRRLREFTDLRRAAKP